MSRAPDPAVAGRKGVTDTAAAASSGMDIYSRRRAVLGTLGSALTIGVAGCLGGSDADIERDTYGEWFRGANNFEGTVDRTGRDTVDVAVGAGQGLAFDPAAVRITVGTTVVWEWTGLGSSHNVHEETGAFQSEYYFEDGETFEHTFEEPGVYRYVCDPHRTQGMLGAVDVVEA